jgi:hypothetical protein
VARVLISVFVTAWVACGSLYASALAAAGTALIMGGNSHPLSVPEDTPDFISGYVTAADNAYIAPSGLCGTECTLVAAYTPEEIRLVTGLFDMTFDESVAVGQANLNACIQGLDCTVTLSPYVETESRTTADDTYVIYGYSQSATVAGNQKLALIAHPVASTVSFVMVANPNRPNGGILQRFVGAFIPLLGISFNGATPTFSPQPRPLLTVDVARQYDGWADFPTNPANLLADLNALMGTVLLHPNYFDAESPQLQGQYQDSTYYLIPAPITPLLVPLTWVPVVGTPLAIALDPAVRVLVEMGYDRTINPGQPTAADFFYVPNLLRAALNFVTAIPTGWDDAISHVTGNPDCRPFHTTVETSPFGVGGPPVYTGDVDPYGEPTPYLAPPVEEHTDAVPVSAIPDGGATSDSTTDFTVSTDPTVVHADVAGGNSEVAENEAAAPDDPFTPTDDVPATTEKSEGDPIENASTMSSEDGSQGDSATISGGQGGTDSVQGPDADTDTESAGSASSDAAA